MPKYFLPCQCGRGVAIELTQAGQRLACSCGQLLDVPNLRGVRALATVDDDSPRRTTTPWDPTRGLIFASSLILLLVGTATALYAYRGLSVVPDISREVEQESFAVTVDDMTLEQLYENWKVVREHGLGAQGHNPYVNLRVLRTRLWRIFSFGVALGLAGGLGVIGSVATRGASQKTNRS